MKQAIIAPGWPDSGLEDKYLSLKSTFEARGYSVDILAFNWDDRTVSSLVNTVTETIEDTAETITF